MIAGLLGFFGRYLIVVPIAAAVGLVGVVGVLWVQKRDAEKQVAELTIDKERLEAAVDAYKIVIAGKDDAIAELEQQQKESEQRAADLAALLEEIRNAPASDNGPIAPVLDRTLRGLDGGVRKPPRGAARPKGSVGRR